MPFIGPKANDRACRARAANACEDSPVTAPIDDGWEPEPERPPLTERLGGGPVDYFRAVPARFFAWLGAIVFVGGWTAAVYISWFADDDVGGVSLRTFKLQNFMSEGLQATIAAGILWAVAAFLWVKVLPAAAEEGPDTA
jgi:hypothetical protein